MSDSEQADSTINTKSFRLRILTKVGLTLLAIVLLLGGLYGYTYAQTPPHLRRPSFQHYHFRTQIVVDGAPVDFSQDQFQVALLATASCNTALSATPIHFHDKQDQLTHVHWDGITGGEFLKYFGWNFIGGGDELLGRRYDSGLLPKSINIYGKLLPAVPNDTNYYVYVGDQQKYERKNWEDFLKQDLEVFFGKESTLGRKATQGPQGWLDRLFPKVAAHGEADEKQLSVKTEEELSRINNLIGNVVIFAQKDAPSDEQVHARFDKLVELKESTCGD